MGKFNCRKDTKDLIAEATEKFGAVYTVDGSNEGRAEVVSGLIERVVDDIDRESELYRFTVDVDEPVKELVFCVECDELVLQGDAKTAFFDVIKIADTVEFERVNGARMRMQIAVKGIWKLRGH